ncbi:hypothetical protein [Streptomyces virginiae]|uniref:hypothetical protein n=1 Tax=Streptomyces virginiae TaxID=1961 RepID=UPI0034276B3C
MLPVIRMPGLDGSETTRRLSASDRPRIVIVTTFGLDEYVRAALHGEAAGSPQGRRPGHAG